MDNINIKGPEEYNLYFNTSREGNVWLDGKGKPIPLDQPLANQACTISPYDLWNARCTRTSIHPKDTPPRQGGAYNSTAVDKYTPNFNTPLSLIMETAINMPQSHGLSSGDNIVQNLRADPNISSNLLQTALNRVNPGNNVIQSAQATPTSSNSPLDNQGSAIGNLDSNQPDNNSNNKPQHPISTSEFKKN